MKKNFAFCLLFFASLLFVFSSVETAAQKKKPGPKPQDPVREFWTKQRDKAFEKRTSPTGMEVEGLVVPEALSGDITKQRAKIEEMKQAGATVPLDYADLVQRFQKGELVELPVVTETYFLDVGGSASEQALTSFDFDEGSVELKPTDTEYQLLQALADDFGGTKYDLKKPADRRLFKIRLLRMIAPQAKVVLEELAAAYQNRFKRPLRVTSLTRTVEYQIELSKTNANSFLVRGKDTIPPHSTGLSFDLGYKHMTAEEQNFLMNKIEDLEKAGKIDGLRETGINATLHVFVFGDGKPAKVVE